MLAACCSPQVLRGEVVLTLAPASTAALPSMLSPPDGAAGSRAASPGDEAAAVEPTPLRPLCVDLDAVGVLDVFTVL